MPYDPNNPARDRVVRDREGMSGATIAALMFGLILLLGVMIWAFTGDRQVASTDRPATTGQSTETPRPGSPPQSNPGTAERPPVTTPKAQ
jgi:hypothetical protein